LVCTPHTTKFWATVCKTVRSMLSIRCLSCPVCLFVCNVGALWPNGWIDQHETWHTGRGFGLGHIVLDGDSVPSAKGGRSPLPQFSARFYRGQMAECIKMPPCMEVGLSPGDLVFDEDPATPEKRHTTPTQFLVNVFCGPPNGLMDQNATWYGGQPRPRRRCVRWGRSSP